MRRWVVAFTCAALGWGPGSLGAQEDPGLVGDWIGTLGDGQIRLILHVTRGSDGGYSATLDSPDQGAMGLPATAVVEGSKITLRFNAPPASYAGELADGSITGTWSQGGATIPLTFEPHDPAPAGETEGDEGVGGGLSGTWRGALNGGALPLVFHLDRRADGSYFGTADSPSQGATGIPISEVEVAGDSLRITLAGIGAVFSGSFEGEPETADSVVGIFRQGGAALPLTLGRGEGAPQSPALERPQHPEPPFPYRVREVSFSNPRGPHVLAGTLTVPDGVGPFAAAVLISGSGPQDRDETIAGHKPFLVLADHLTREGVAVLRFDDRGVGGSGGDFAAATSRDFATDVGAAVEYLRTQSEIDPTRVGLIGHSEGGLVAPMVAEEDPSIAFSVLLAGTGVTGAEILTVQTDLILQAAGAGEERRRVNGLLHSAMVSAAGEGLDASQILERVTKVVDGLTTQEISALGFDREGLVELLSGQAGGLTTPWFRFFLSHDPASVLERVTSPVLALNGSLDLQVDPDQNLPAIEEALTRGGNRHFEVRELTGLNHLFQPAETGSPTEYATIEETFAREALDIVSEWIRSVVAS